MKGLNTAYRIIRNGITNACKGKPVTEWRKLSEKVLSDLQTQKVILSWTLSVNIKLRGLVVRVTTPDLPPAILSVIPTTGKYFVAQSK